MEYEQVNMNDIQLGNQIGGGGFAIVYDGYWKKRKVALKTMFDTRADADLKAEFENEIFVMSQLDHPNIVRLFAASLKAPNYVMVMELCDTSIFNILHVERQTLSEKIILKLLGETAAGLEYLHSQSPAIIHRDIKSQNVLVTNEMQVKLCDFGLVGSRVTQAGTPAYMAPELLENGLFSRKVDVYAFAILMWEMFSGNMPYGGWDPHEVKDYVLSGKRLRVPYDGCPKLCGKLIEKCWDDDPDKRPEFKNVKIALDRLYSSSRDVSHSEEVSRMHDGDSFDQLASSHRKK